MTESRYLWRRLQRALQKYPSDNRWVSIHVLLAQLALVAHVDAKVRPSMTDTVWRSKRDGGPLRLDFSRPVQEAA